MDRNLALEFVRVSEAAAIAAAKWIGRGDKNRADGAAVDEMRDRFNQMDFKGTIVIGEGSKDEAPELYTGEKVGKGSKPLIDLAVDPLECTTSVADGLPNAMSVIASGPHGSLLSAPDTYMQKIAAGPRAKKVIRLDQSVPVTIRKVAKALGKKPSDICVAVLDRPRHEKLIAEIRKVGGRVKLFTDGDVSAAMATCLPDSGIDLLMGTGGSTEAVLAAVAVKILGGEILCRFNPPNEKHANLVKKARLNTKKIYTANDMAKGKMLTFTATGIMEGLLLRGVRVTETGTTTHSIVIRGESGTIRYIETHHGH
ncbi:MAG TPA: class II fructose-bisphosphatase [Candidatus Paceibacterota bacterium]